MPCNEAQLLTFDQLRALAADNYRQWHWYWDNDENVTFVWVEIAKDEVTAEMVKLALPLYPPHCHHKEVEMLYIGTDKPDMLPEFGYELVWRCWDGKPTIEQRKSIPFN